MKNVGKADKAKLNDGVSIVNIETKMVNGRKRPRAGVTVRILDKDGKIKDEKRIAG